jgi:RHS repeat-associated protein
VTGLLDGAGQIAAAYRYDAFGRLLAKSGRLEQPFQFSTKRYDEGTGLNYYGYRFYAPAIGRWMNRDPLGEAGGVNLYGMVGNNAVNWVDPHGLFIGPTLEIAAGVAFVGTGLTGAYFVGTVRWGDEINDLLRDAWDKLNEECNKGFPDPEYAQALKDHIDQLTQAGNLNIRQAIMYGLGLTKPFMDMPLLPAPPIRPTLPEPPSHN